MRKILLFFTGIFLVYNVYALPVRYVVATDGTGDYAKIQDAINACPDNERSIIFIRNGTYYGQVSIGTKTVASNKIISLLGESRDSVIVTYDKSLPMVTSFEQATTFQIYAKNFYAENISFVNSAGNTGQALALYTAGDMATFKNCTLKGYQDTYRAKKGTRAYFKNSWIEGAVDFIYAGGTVFFDDCTINCVNGGGYIVAPEDTYKFIPAASTASGKDLNLEFIFRNCNITANSNVAVNTYTLGRPWNVSSGAYYINCKLGSHIKAAGWTTMSGNETTASFGEYNSMDKDGNLLNTSGRISWSFQLAKQDVDNLLTPAYVYNQISTTAYDPLTICIQPDQPTLNASGINLSWNSVTNAAGYIIFKNNKYIGNTNNTIFSDDSGTPGNYTIRAITSTGVMSQNLSSNTAVLLPGFNTFRYTIQDKFIFFNQILDVTLISLDGKIELKKNNISKININHLPGGVYILNAKDMNGATNLFKILL